MSEFSEQIEKYRREKTMLDSLVKRMNDRSTEIGAQIRALEVLERQAKSQTAIPAEVLNYIERYLPQNGSKRESVTPLLLNPPYTVPKIDPSQKTHVVLSLMYHDGRKAFTSGEVVEMVQASGHTMSKDDVYKVLSRQTSMGRLMKRQGVFTLTETGARMVKVLDSEAHLVE